MFLASGFINGNGTASCASLALVSHDFIREAAVDGHERHTHTYYIHFLSRTGGEETREDICVCFRGLFWALA